MTMAATSSRPVPTIEMRQRPMTAVTMKRIATMAAMPAMISRPGITALTSVYCAPVMSGLSFVSAAYWSSQRLTAWSAT